MRLKLMMKVMSLEDLSSESEASDSEEENQIYEVSFIMGSRERNGDTEYLIKWRGWENPTWEPEYLLTDCSEILAEYKVHRAQRLLERRSNSPRSMRRRKRRRVFVPPN